MTEKTRKGLNLFYLWIMMDRAKTELLLRAGDDVGLKHFAYELGGAAEVVLEVAHMEQNA